MSTGLYQTGLDTVLKIIKGKPVLQTGGVENKGRGYLGNMSNESWSCRLQCCRILTHTRGKQSGYLCLSSFSIDYSFKNLPHESYFIGMKWTDTELRLFNYILVVIVRVFMKILVDYHNRLIRLFVLFIKHFLLKLALVIEFCKPLTDHVIIKYHTKGICLNDIT